MPDGRYLQEFRDGKRSVAPEPLLLPEGAQGNIQTLSRMAQIVREDAVQRDLRNFIRRSIPGCDADTLEAQVDAAYKFCRDQIKYRDEADNTETVADLWSCMFSLNDDHPVGDCAVKSVALATAIASISSLKIQPRFIAIKQDPGADYFNHVYVEIVWPDGRIEPLDPTPAEFVPGEIADSVEQMRYYIWPVNGGPQ